MLRQEVRHLLIFIIIINVLGDSNSANSRVPIIAAIATASVLLLVAVIIIIITIYQR